MIKPSPMIFNTFQVFKPDFFTFSTFRIQRDGIPKFKKALGLGLNSAKPVGIGIKFRTTLGCTLPYLASQGLGQKLGVKWVKNVIKTKNFNIFWACPAPLEILCSLPPLELTFSPPLKKILVTPMNTYITIQTKNIAYTSFSIGL